MSRKTIKKLYVNFNNFLSQIIKFIKINNFQFIKMMNSFKKCITFVYTFSRITRTDQDLIFKLTILLDICENNF